VLEGRLGNYHCLCDDVLDVIPQLLRVASIHILMEVVKYPGKTPLVAPIIVLVLSLNEVVIVLINCVVCKVHIEIVEILLHWAVVLIGCESGDALLINKNAKRIHSVNKRINSKVELQPVDEVGLVDIPLRHEFVVGAEVHVLEFAS